MNLKKITLIVSLAIIIRLLLLSYSYWPSPDGVTYSLVGKNLVEGRGYTLSGDVHTLFPPFYPILIGFLYKITGNLQLPGHLISLICGICFLFPFYQISKSFYGKKIAAIAIILALFNGFFIRSSLRMMSDMLFAFLLFTSILISWKWINDKPRSKLTGILVGFLFGITYLTRPEGFLFFIIIGFWFIGVTKLKYRQTQISFTIFLVSFFIVAFPYINFLHENTGKWQLSGKMGFNLVIGEFITNQDFVGYQKSMAYISDDYHIIALDSQDIDSFEYIQTHLPAYLLRISKNFLAQERLIQIFISVFGIFIIGYGIAKQNWDRKHIQKEIFVISMWIPALVYPFFFINLRFLLPFLPWLLLWLSRGIQLLSQSLNNSRFKQSKYFLIGFFLIYASKPLFEIYLPTHHPVEHKQMGLWIKNNIPSIRSEKIVSRRPLISFYANAQPIILPYGNTIEDLILCLKKENIRYLIIDERYTAPDYIPYRPLLDEQNQFDDLILKHIIYNPAKIFLYEIKSQTSDS